MIYTSVERISIKAVHHTHCIEMDVLMTNGRLLIVCYLLLKDFLLHTNTPRIFFLNQSCNKAACSSSLFRRQI